jgi:hypothetical protein
MGQDRLSRYAWRVRAVWAGPVLTRADGLARLGQRPRTDSAAPLHQPPNRNPPASTGPQPPSLVTVLRVIVPYRDGQERDQAAAQNWLSGRV